MCGKSEGYLSMVDLEEGAGALASLFFLKSYHMVPLTHLV